MPFQDETLGFARSYSVEINPELPPSGAWREPAFEFGSHRGDAVAVRVRPHVGLEWVAKFALDGRLRTGMYATPGMDQFVVLTGMEGYLFNASVPGIAKRLPVWPARAVHRPHGAKLLLVASYTDVVAIDGVGIRWTTDGLFLDDLEFVDRPSGYIVVRGRLKATPDSWKLLELDPETGRVVAA